MAVDHAARAAQVARIIAHAGAANENTGLFSWTAPDSGKVYSFPAAVHEDKRDALEVDRDDSNENTVRIIVAASVFAAEFPRVGQSFKDAAGRNYRIQKIISPPFSPTAAFRCGNLALS